MSKVTESDVRGVNLILFVIDILQWFESFGEIESIELPKDHITGKLKGHAIIEFKHYRDAKTAAKKMNGFDIMGKKLKVSLLTDSVNK